MLAPLALVACAIAVLSVVNATDSDTGDTDRSEQAQARQGGQNDDGGGGGGGGDSDAPATYTVETGDTLGSIAADTGVSLDKLEQLNPDIDPTALQAGQELKLK